MFFWLSHLSANTEYPLCTKPLASSHSSGHLQNALDESTRCQLLLLALWPPLRAPGPLHLLGASGSFTSWSRATPAGHHHLYQPLSPSCSLLQSPDRPCGCFCRLLQGTPTSVPMPFDSWDNLSHSVIEENKCNLLVSSCHTGFH